MIKQKQKKIQKMKCKLEQMSASNHRYDKINYYYIILFVLN